MEKTKQKIDDICELKDKLILGAKEAMSKGIQNVSTGEMSQVTDMIKDLAEAEKECWEALYYKSIVEAMNEEKEMGEMNGRMGYDNWRYSSGRFAPTGHGHRSGYRPGEEIDPWMMAEGFGENDWNGTMGYRGGASYNSNQNGSSNGSNGRMGYTGSPRGDHYARYAQARMGYHESKDPEHKRTMDASAREYVVDMAEAVKEMWKDADPAMRKEIKNKFVALTGELN